MKAAITERRPNGDVVSIEIEPLLPSGAPQMHTIKCTRTYIEDRTKQVSRFNVDTEQAVWDFVRLLSHTHCKYGDVNGKIIMLWQDNNLNEVLA